MVDGQEGRVFTSAQSEALRNLLDMKWGTTVKASVSQMRLLGRLTDDYPKDRNITMRECSLLIEAHKSPSFKKQAILDELATMNSWFKAKAKELETTPEAWGNNMAKKNEKKEEETQENELEQAMAQMQLNNQQLQGTAQNLANQLQQYMALCSHYEQTINVLTGRVQELKQSVASLQSQLQPEWTGIGGYTDNNE